LRQLRALDIAQDGRGKPYEFTKILKHFEEKGVDSNISYKCLVEWNAMNKSQLSAYFFALSLRNPTTIV
jgi:hypothetical protein